MGFSPDGTRILTGSDDGSARIWDLEGRLVAKMRGVPGRVMLAAFSPAGNVVATSSTGNLVVLWDGEGRETCVLEGHGTFLTDLAFSPDGKRLATASYDGTVRVWTLGTKDLVDLAARRITRDFTPEEREKYKDLLGEPTGAGR